MVDRVRMPGRHDLAHATRIRHRGEQRHDPRHARAQAFQSLQQFAMDAVEREFGAVHQQQCGCIARDDLSAKLAADGAAGAGHQHHLAANVLAEQDRMGRDGVTPQEVFDVQFAQVADLYLALGEFHQARQRTHRYPDLPHLLEDLVTPLARSRGDGQEDVADVQYGHLLLQRRGIMNRQAMDQAALQALVVVEEAQQPQLAAGGQGLGELAAGIACAVDQHPREFAAAQQPLIDPSQPATGKKTRNAHGKQQQQRLDQTDGARHARDADRREHQAVGRGINPDCLRDGRDGRPPAVAEDGAIQPELHEERQGQGQRDPHGPQVAAGQDHPGVEAQRQREPDREHAEAGIHPQHQSTLGDAGQRQQGGRGPREERRVLTHRSTSVQAAGPGAKPSSGPATSRRRVRARLPASPPIRRSGQA